MFVLVMSISSSHNSISFGDAPESLLNLHLKELEDTLQEAKSHDGLAVIQRKKSVLVSVPVLLGLCLVYFFMHNSRGAWCATILKRVLESPLHYDSLEKNDFVPAGGGRECVRKC